MFVSNVFKTFGWCVDLRTQGSKDDLCFDHSSGVGVGAQLGGLGASQPYTVTAVLSDEIRGSGVQVSRSKVVLSL